MYRVNSSSTDWGDCSTAKYERIYDKNGYQKDPYSLKITNTVYPKKFQNGNSGNKFNQTGSSKRLGTLRQPNAPDSLSGDLTVKLFDFIPAAPYLVLETDYDNYSVVYSCSHFFGLGTNEFLWVFSRKPLEIG